MKFKFNVEQIFSFLKEALIYKDVNGCGSVGRVVASYSRGPWFKSIHQPKFILNVYYQLYWKDKNKEKEAGNGTLFLIKKYVEVELLNFKKECNWTCPRFFSQFWPAEIFTRDVSWNLITFCLILNFLQPRIVGRSNVFTHQCDQIGQFLKVSGKKFIAFWAIFKNVSFQV